ncbi:restriction endonuclease [Streptomyces sp. SID14478]|uniref:restriction endonuclease n=1 Tax=Streptomyces sp. SID14478 TaxID=2706073 RepID=UPI0013DF5AF7|nr:restriction endonuclease [Streptomyces sp. SID14478]NEB81889.1 restriction endonuclease [Streptomyces sp. SID14478]
MRGLLVTFALVGSLICASALLFVRFAHWAGNHPLTAALLAIPAVAVLYTLLRAMPRFRELRRAAQGGMAQADRELAAAQEEFARMPWPDDVREPSPTIGPEEPTLPLPPSAAHDGRTAVLPPLAFDFAALDPDGFEAAIAALCERDGCFDIEVVGGAGDLGADVLATAPDGRRVVIQCKQYGPAHKVGSQDLQRFGGTCWTVHGAQLAAVVTTSEFTAPAEEYAAACGIRCVDGASLHAWAEGSGPAPWGPARADEGTVPLEDLAGVALAEEA